jgi:hypothetical protein
MLLLVPGSPSFPIYLLLSDGVISKTSIGARAQKQATTARARVPREHKEEGGTAWSHDDERRRSRLPQLLGGGRGRRTICKTEPRLRLLGSLIGLINNKHKGGGGLSAKIEPATRCPTTWQERSQL